MPTRSLALDGARDQLLADAAFAFDQDRNVGCRGALAEGDDALHAVGAADEIVEGQRAFDRLLDARQLFGQRFDLHGAAHRDFETLRRSRLDDEVDRTEAHGADGCIERAVGRQHDDRRAGFAFEAIEHAHAVEAGHDEIEQHERD